MRAGAGGEARRAMRRAGGLFDCNPQGESMTAPFNMPDEFVRGFFKSGQTLLQAYTGAAEKPGDAPAAAPKMPALALAQAQAHYWQQQMALYMGMMASATGQAAEPAVQPERGDRRFSADMWRENPWYSLLK